MRLNHYYYSNKSASDRFGFSKYSCLFSVIDYRNKIFGGYTGGVTPVPIPNTEVKLSRADDTMTERSWESRTLPEYNKKAHYVLRNGLFLCLLSLAP